MSRRILIFSLGYYPAMVGGAEVAIKEITDRIEEDVAIFDMITLRYDKHLPRFEKIGNVNVYRIGFSVDAPDPQALVRFPLYLLKVWYPIGAFLKSLELHRTNSYTDIWSMMSYMGFPAVFLKFFYPGIRFILTLQEGDTIAHITKRARIRFVSFLYKIIFKNANLVQVISSYLADFARSMGYKGHVEIIPNGVDIAHFSKSHEPEKLNEVKQELHKHPDDVFLITTSRLVEKNALEDVISALTFLPQTVKFIIAGTGPLEALLREQVKELKLEDRVIFLGFVEHARMPLYLKVADIFIRPSLSEGMGNSFIEAMAAGIPAIATNVGGIADFLKDNETGLVVQVKNPEDIAQKVKTLISDKSLRDHIINNAKQLASTKYDWSSVVSDMRQKVFNV